MSVHLKVKVNVQPKIPDYRNFRDADHRTKYPSLQPKGSGSKKQDETYKLEVSKQYAIAPAYSKGAYQVVPLSEIETAGRKV